MAPAMQHQGLLEAGHCRYCASPAPCNRRKQQLLRSEHFLIEPLYGVLLKNHPMAKRRKISMRELARRTVRAE